VWVARVPGTAVFLTRATRDTPPVLAWRVRHNRALHQHIIALTAITESIPWIADDERISLTEIGAGFWRVVVRYGFMERPVSVKDTSVCIVDDTSKIVREVKVRSEPKALLKVLTNPAYCFKRIGLEAGPLSQ
jgi:K+ transporter